MIDPKLLSPGRLNVKNEEIDEMIKEAPGPINFTVFLTMFGEKLKGERAPGELGSGQWRSVASLCPKTPAIPTIPMSRDPDLIPCLPNLLEGCEMVSVPQFPQPFTNPKGLCCCCPTGRGDRSSCSISEPADTSGAASGPPGYSQALTHHPTRLHPESHT